MIHDHQTWDRAVVGLFQRRSRSVAAALAVVVMVVGFMPVADAHDWQASGINAAQLKVTPDGYSGGLGSSAEVLVAGRSFKPGEVASVYQCIAGEQRPLDESCGLRGAALIDASGGFSATVRLGVYFYNENGTTQGPPLAVIIGPRTPLPATWCFGNADYFGSGYRQCSLIVQTSDPISGEPTSRAEHHICFADGSPGRLNPGCIPGPPDDSGVTTTTSPSTTTTTTTFPNDAELSLDKDDGLGLVYPYNDVIQVTGRKFRPGDVAHIFQCGANDVDPRSRCSAIGTAPTDASGGFGPVPVPVVNYDGSFRCGRVSEPDCSVVAATFAGPTSNQQTSRAQYYFCFASLGTGYPCTPGPASQRNTTTTTTAPTTTTTVPPPPPRNHVADFAGNGSTDVSVFRPTDGVWYVKDGAWTQWGQNGDIPVPADYDGDGATDVAIFRPDTGLWAIRHSSGIADLFVTYGIATDIPVPADYDGDDKADIAIFRPEYGLWWVHESSTNTDVATTFGIATDIPVPADYDGDGKANIAVYRDGTWFALGVTGGYTSTSWGSPGDIPAPGDYDGDGFVDNAVFRSSTGLWAIQRSSDDAADTFTLGSPGDVPVSGDYDADGDTDAAVFRPSAGEWYLRDGTTFSWGIQTDVPLPTPYAIRRAFFG